MLPSFGKKNIGAPQRSTSDGEVAGLGKASDEALVVLEAANEFGDHSTAAACRRVIEASRQGVPALASDVQVVVNYFR